MPIPVDLSKLSNVVKNEVVRKTVYDKLVTKINNIDTSEFFWKTRYQTDKAEVEKKIPNTSRPVKKSDYNAKIIEIEAKIPSISNLVKKADYDTKISELEKKLTDHKDDKYITTPEFSKLTAERFCCKISTSKFNNKN